MKEYVHGYSNQETARLADQANTLAELLHYDTHYPAGSTVLEVGCGVGAQTVILAQNSPEALITAIDISPDSLNQARATVNRRKLNNVTFKKANIFDLPFADNGFDHIFVCFVLEHLAEPVEALARLKRVLKPGGSITVIEGDHGSYYSHPASAEASRAVQCLIDLQARLKGNSRIGRQLYPLLRRAGFAQVSVSPRMVYVDASKPALVEGFSRKTFIAMVEAVQAQALALSLIDKKTWDKGIADLYRATAEDGTFCYTFFKGLGVKSVSPVDS
ncbi:MAG: methyltransferase domain-containing protein [Anaerolineae bacterium]|nr:methyltransferase domain-containing protein [Anaerolineae bacterium]